jgi:phosphate transport system substrate-binding protein
VAAGKALKFFDWAYKNGKAQATDLHYVSIPDSVVTQIEASWSAITADGKPIFAAQ